jgi:predicted nucleic acid-binding protein
VILVDSSVWIDYFRGVITPQTDRLDALLGRRRVSTGDLVVAEVLRGFDADLEFDRAYQLLTSVRIFELCGLEVATASAVNFRKLRRLGITIRKTIDTIIATYCIRHGHELLYTDRDFDPFVKHLGLRSAMSGI